MTWTLIALDTENYDVGNNFNTTTSKFIVPIPGKYQVFGNIEWKSGTVITDSLYQMGIYVGAETAAGSLIHASANNALMNFNILETSFSIGDEITLKGVQHSGVDTVDVQSGTMATWLSVKLVSKT